MTHQHRMTSGPHANKLDGRKSNAPVFVTLQRANFKIMNPVIGTCRGFGGVRCAGLPMRFPPKKVKQSHQEEKKRRHNRNGGVSGFTVWIYSGVMP